MGSKWGIWKQRLHSVLRWQFDWWSCALLMGGAGLGIVIRDAVLGLLLVERRLKAEDGEDEAKYCDLKVNVNAMWCH